MVVKPWNLSRKLRKCGIWRVYLGNWLPRSALLSSRAVGAAERRQRLEGVLTSGGAKRQCLSRGVLSRTGTEGRQLLGGALSNTRTEWRRLCGGVLPCSGVGGLRPPAAGAEAASDAKTASEAPLQLELGLQRSVGQDVGGVGGVRTAVHGPAAVDAAPGGGGLLGDGGG